MMRASAVILGLLVAASLLAQDIPVSTTLDARAAGSQLQPAVATDGSRFLAVWQDGRSGDGRSAIYGARIDESGSIRPQDRFLITDDGASPAVAWDGRAYVVVWRTMNGTGAFRRIDADGIFLESWPRELPGLGYEPQIATSNHGTLVAMFRGGLGSMGSIELSLITPLGEVIQRGTIEHARTPAIACTRDECLLAWDVPTPGWGDVAPFPEHVSWHIVGQRLAHDGSPIGTPQTLSQNAFSPRLAATRDAFLLAWMTENEGWWSIRGRVGEGEAFTIVPPADVAPGDFSVTTGGEQFLATWISEAAIETRRGSRARRGIEAQFIDARGLGGAPFTIAVSDVTHAWWMGGVDAATNGKAIVAAWVDADRGEGAKVAAAMQWGRAPAVRLPVAVSASRQESPAIILAGDHYLIVWIEHPGNGARRVLYARRFRLDGSPFDAAPIAVATSSQRMQGAVAAFNRDSYLIAWSGQDQVEAPSEDQVEARRMRADGTLGTQFRVGRSHRSPSIASHGRDFGLLYADASESGEVLTFARVDGDGIGSRTALSGGAPYSLASDALGYAVVSSVGGWPRALSLQHLTREGQPVEDAPIQLWKGGNDLYSPSIVCASDCVVAWYEFLGRINAARVRERAVIMVGENFDDILEFSPRATDRFEPQLVRHGSGELILSVHRTTIYATPIRELTFSEETIALQGTEPVIDFASAPGPDGIVAIAYQRADPKSGGAPRIFLRLTRFIIAAP